ncbi:hypothetical protein C8F01DRAFT_1123015 [Mycena amicta]|nr:hypothetical protein C8F01DRAFT_1123015 [Mycena amicta]
MSIDTPVPVVAHSHSPPPVTIMSLPPPSSSNSSVTSLVALPDSLQNTDVDAQILEALSGKDRIYVLKLGESMEGLINDRGQSRQRIDLTPATTYQRMLVHRCAAYYILNPETDPLTKVISISMTSESRVPARRISDLSPPLVEAAPKFKIMMRKPMSSSQASSVTGDDGDVSDVEASETGSLGGRSSASASKPRMTIEERTAAYNEARNRIFIDFEEKDQSSASSSASLVSGSSTSASGDDPGSPATESEWSGPSTKKHPPHRANSSSSSRSLRSSAPAFMSSNSSPSSRNSRAPSPAFKYPTLYEPPPPGAGISIAVPPFDAAAHAHAPGFQGAAPQQQQQPQMPYYPYPPMPQGQQQQPYMAPYPYYGHYSHPPANGSDPEIYAYPYAWSGPAYLPQQNGGTPPNPLPQNHPHHMNGSPPPMQPYGYGLPHGTPSPPAGYPGYEATPTNANMPYGHGQPYYPPHLAPHQHIPMPPYMSPPPQLHHTQSFEAPRVNGRNGNTNGNGGMNGSVNGRRNGTVNGHGIGKGRPGVAPPQRAAWSFGPGVSGGVVDFPSMAGSSPVGPRLSGSMGGYGPGMGMRRTSSGNRTTSGSGSSAGDDVSSVASSSTTSSSSRRTYTSTTSSQHHPLPARPDWAVGLRPNPTLHAPRHRDHDGRDNSRGSSSTSNSGNSSPHGRHQQHDSTPPALTDFPPLSTGPGSGLGSGSGSVQRTPGGAWTNPSSTRSIVMTQVPVQAGASALVTHEPKITLVRRPTSSSVREKEKERDRARGDAVANAILVNQVTGMTLEERERDRDASVLPQSVGLGTPG